MSPITFINNDSLIAVPNNLLNTVIAMAKERNVDLYYTGYKWRFKGVQMGFPKKDFPKMRDVVKLIEVYNAIHS